MRSGRVQASYIADDGRRYYCPHTFDTRTDAEGWLANEKKLIDMGEWTPPGVRAQAVAGISLREYSAQWMAQRKLTPKTRHLYEGLLTSRILPQLGAEGLKSITPATVRSWWVGLPDTPTRNNQAYRLLRAMFNTAIEDKLVRENPCQIKSAKQPAPREVQALTPEELNVVAGVVPEKYRAAVLVTAWCGLRFGELIELRRRDVQTISGYTTLKIRRAATMVGAKLVTGVPKTAAGVRDVTIPPHVAEILKQHMRDYTDPGPDALVFTSVRGRRLHKDTFSLAVKRGYAAVGKDMRVHDLRHIGATYAAQAGATTKELMRRIGHTTPAMAMRYQIAAAERDAAIADRLSEMINKPS
jgi:integrase